MYLKKLFSFLAAAAIIVNIFCIIPIKAKAENGSDVVSTIPGDTNGDYVFDDQDAIHLLFCVYFPETYMVSGQCSDFNGDSELTDQDAVYLLFSLYFPETYLLPKTYFNSYNGLEKINEDNTYITVNITDNLTLDMRGIYGIPQKEIYNGIISLDWGDSETIEDVAKAYEESQNNLKHTYSSPGEYVITLTGMTQFMGLWVRANSSIINRVELSSKITKIQQMAMDGLDTLVVNNPEPFDIYNQYDEKITVINNIGKINRIEIPENSFLSFYDSDKYDAILKNALVKPDDNLLYDNITVTVGENGDFTSINEAMRYLSVYFPTYRSGGIHAYIKILSGTVIKDQIFVDGYDCSWMVITYEDYLPSVIQYSTVCQDIAEGKIIFDDTENFNTVKVDATDFSGISHDTRGDVCFLRAENGGKLPQINCVFKLVNNQKNNIPVAGMVCNKGSIGVVNPLCGFIGFYDGVIANNESSVTIREGITMDCTRWGCHARHNGEISARSIIATGCAKENSFESAAVSADRIADLDSRGAYISNKGVQIRCNNTSRMNCNGMNIVGDGENTVEIVNENVSTLNAISMLVSGTVKITNASGSTMLVGNYNFDKEYIFNTLTANGVIYKQ